jgi:hypothetical protein
MNIAIQTKYIGATNTKPSRIKASAEGVPSKTFTADYLDQLADLDHLNRHQRAAHCFALANNWSTSLASGRLPDPDVWVHCFLPWETKKAVQALGAAIESGDPQDIADAWLYQLKPLIH